MALAFLMHCIILLSAHVCSYMLDHTEPELEEMMEQAQVEDLVNLALDQGKSWCIPIIILGLFLLNLYIYVILDCALSYRNYVGIVVALWLSFQIILDYPLLVVVCH
jgi:hypothetical protein